MHLQFDGIKKNKVQFDPLKISVDQSASPVFLPIRDKLKNIQITGSVVIKKPIANDPSWEDQYFSLGIIYEGDYKPGFFSRTMMPSWLLSLYNSAGKNITGIGNIEFWGVFKKPNAPSISSENFNLKIIKNYGASLDHKNNFKLTVQPKDLKVLALWFHSDGDDTKSKFVTSIQSIKIK